METKDLEGHDLRWLWLAVTLAGATVAAAWFAQGGHLYRSDADAGGMAGAAATTARFAVLLALGAAAVDLVGMLSAKRTHTVPGAVSLVCAVAGAAAIVAIAVHARAATREFGWEPDAWLIPTIGACAAFTIGGFGLWADARAEHRRAVRALAEIEQDIHRIDGDLM
jgi:hypothetical protein